MGTWPSLDTLVGQCGTMGGLCFEFKLIRSTHAPQISKWMACARENAATSLKLHDPTPLKMILAHFIQYDCTTLVSVHTQLNACVFHIYTRNLTLEHRFVYLWNCQRNKKLHWHLSYVHNIWGPLWSDLKHNIAHLQCCSWNVQKLTREICFVTDMVLCRTNSPRCLGNSNEMSTVRLAAAWYLIVKWTPKHCNNRKRYHLSFLWPSSNWTTAIK